MPGKRKPSEKMRAFARFLSRGDMQNVAYKRAYNAAGMKEDTVHRKACALAKHPDVVAMLDELRARRSAKAEIEDAEILRSAKRAMDYDLRRLFDRSGGVLPPGEWPDDIAAVIDGFEVTEKWVGHPDEEGARLYSRTYKCKGSPRHVGRDQLFRHRGLYKADNEQRRDSLSLWLASLDVERRALIEAKLRELIDRSQRLPGSAGKPDSGRAGDIRH